MLNSPSLPDIPASATGSGWLFSSRFTGPFHALGPSLSACGSWDGFLRRKEEAAVREGGDDALMSGVIVYKII